MPYATKYSLSDEDIKKIAREYEKKGPEVLAKELRVPSVKVRTIATRLRKYGVKIPTVTRYLEIVKSLKGESPELFDRAEIEDR